MKSGDSIAFPASTREAEHALFRTGSPMQHVARTLLHELEMLYGATQGVVEPEDPVLARLVPVLAKHGKALWLAGAHDSTPQALKLRLWLRDLATAPPKEWQVFRQGIISLVRCVGAPPRPTGQALLSNDALIASVLDIRDHSLRWIRPRRVN